MELDQAKALLNTPSMAPVAPGTNISGSTTNLAPQTTNAVASLTSGLPPGSGNIEDIDQSATAKYLKENQDPNVPLDISTGAPAWDRLMLSFRRMKEDQVSYLKNKYGETNVRTDKNGEIIMRVADSETGKPKDVLVNEKGMSAKDFLDLAGAAPEVAAGIFALRGGKALPAIGKLKGILGMGRDIVSTALGAETAGAAKDVAAGVIDKGSADVGKIAKERAEMAGADVAIGAVTFPVAKFFKFMKSPLADSRTKVQFDALSAQEHFDKNRGVFVPLSIGESTGSPLAGRTEVFMEKLPGGGTPFKEFKAGQEEQLRKLQMIMMGKTPPTDEDVGKAIIEKLSPVTEAAKTKVGQAEEALKGAGTAGIENIATSQTMPVRQLTRSSIGKTVRDAVTAKRDAVKAEADRLYGVVRSMPGGEGKVFDGTDLKSRFLGILDKLPSVESTTEVPTGILDPYGNPVTRTETGQKVMKEFVPPNVLARLQSFVGMKDPKLSLSDLQQMRREVYDDIAKGEGVPGLGTHYLADIGKAITAAMDEGVSNLPSGDLKQALIAANAHYKNKVVPFNRVGLTELFRAPDESGFVSNPEVVTRLFSGGKAVNNFQLMKETLGAGSKEFGLLKRSIADNLLESSREPGGMFIDPGDFVSKLAKLRTDYPEIANEVFGNKFNEFFRQAKFIQYGRNAKITPQELTQLMNDPSPTAGKLKELVKAQQEQDTLYRNDIMRQVSTKELPDKAINPIEFVDRFVSGKTTPSDVAKAMDLIKQDPTLLEDVRAKVVEKVFRDAARSATPSDIGKLLSGDPTRIVSGTSTFKQIEAPYTRQKLQSVLGPEIFKDLEMYTKLQAAMEQKEKSFEAAGGLAAGMQIANFAKNPLKYFYRAGKDWIAAKLLTSEPMRKWLGSIPFSAEPGFAQLVLSSPPFLQAVTKEFGKGTAAEAFISQAKSAMDRWLGEQPKSKESPAPTDEQERRDLFKKMLNQGVNAALSPAIQTPDGRIVSGDDHVSAYKKAKSSGTPDTSGSKEGFVDRTGKFISREEAAAKTGLPTQTEAGKLHSSDL